MEPDRIPWEDRGPGEAIAAFVATLRSAHRAPRRFFAVLSPEGGYGPPLLFAMIVGTLGAAALVGWEALALRAGIESQGLSKLLEQSRGFGWAVWLTILLAPALVAAQLVLVTAVTHLMLLLLGGARRGYRATFRACAYAQAPEVLYLIPVCGAIVAPVWSLALRIVGLAAVHDTAASRAAAAVLLPVFLCGGLLLLALAWLGLLAGFGSALLAE